METGSTLTISLTIANSPTAGNGQEDITWAVYISSDAIYDIGDIPADTGTIVDRLAAGTSKTPIVNSTERWPAIAGDYYLIAIISAADDTNTANNEFANGYNITDP